ncbi:MAG: cell division protein FtsQ/DivIB [Acidobacteriota bacterium]
MNKKVTASHNLRHLKRVVPIGAAAAVVVIVFLLGAYLFGLLRDFSRTSSLFHLNRIHYAGATHFDSGEMDRLIHSAFPGNTLMIDLNRLRRLVESEDWIESAVVRRQLPDQIFIYMTERKPVAVGTIEGELYVVDPRGNVLAAYGPRFQFIDEPIVKGLKNIALENAREENASRMEVYLRVLRELDSGPRRYTPDLSEIDVRDPNRVAVVPTDEGIPVFLGDSRFLERYQMFLSQKDVYREIKRRRGTVDSVDVTYDNRIIVHTPKEQGKGVSREGL